MKINFSLKPFSLKFGEAQPAPRTDGVVVTSYRSAYYPASQVNPYNPDDLVRKKGGLEVYRKMMVDDQVKAVMAMKTNAILASGWRIDPASEDEPEDQEIADFIEHCLTDGLGAPGPAITSDNFKQSLANILSAMIYGFSVTEKVYKILEGGQWAGKIGLKCLKTRPAHSFELDTDDKNNLTTLRQLASSGTINITGEDLAYFMIYSFHSDNSDLDNWYGVSDLRAAYRPWFSKDMIIRFFNIYLERFGMGIIHAKYPKGMNGTDITELENMVRDVTAKTGFVTADTVNFDILESKARSQSPYLDGIKTYDTAIARSVLVPNLMGFTDVANGTYNLGEKHFDLFMMILQNIRGQLEALINEQLVRPLVKYNFITERFPAWRFKPLTEEDVKKLAELFFTAVEKGVVLPTEEDERFVRKGLNFPQRNKDDVLLPQKPVAQPFGAPGQQPPQPGQPGAPAPAPGAAPAKPPKPGDKAAPPPEEDEDEGEDDAKFAATYGRKPTPFEARLNFKQLTDDMDAGELDTALNIAKIIGRMKDSLYSTITEKGIVAKRDAAAVNKLGLDYLKDLKIEWVQCLRNGFGLGSAHALGEVRAAVGSKFAEGNAEAVGNIPPAQILEYFQQRAFWLTGTMKEDILKNVRAQLLDGIKSGLSNADVIKNLEAYFEKYTVRQLTGQGGLERIQNIPGRIETIVRTNYNDAYNQGRLTMFQSSEVSPFIAAYQYSAILDDRTTDICRVLDGKIYKADNPIWAQITPPNHYNCRSLMIPVFVGEAFTESDPPAMMPDKNFGGMAA